MPSGQALFTASVTASVLWTQVNKIRESLGRVVRNSTAAGLRQPHLERTRLCELSDAELDPVYVRQRDALRGTVRQLARPKSVNGQVRCPSLCAPIWSATFCWRFHSQTSRTSRLSTLCALGAGSGRGHAGMLNTARSPTLVLLVQVMTGPVLAELIETMVGALNARDIPTAGSILEHFNRELVQKARHSLWCPSIVQHASKMCTVAQLTFMVHSRGR